MQTSLWVLLVSTAFIAFTHAVAPDHWMPFAAIGRAQRWSKAKLLWITFISGLGHVGISVLLGVIGILLGFTLSKIEGIENRRGEIVLWLLIGFGIAYMLWGLKEAKKHKHRDIDEEKLRAKTVALWTMFALAVLGPCEPLIPLVFLGYNYGSVGVIGVSVVFSLITIVMMLVQTLLAFMGIHLIKHEVVERYAHALAGFAIALTAIFVMIIE